MCHELDPKWPHYSATGCPDPPGVNLAHCSHTSRSYAGCSGNQEHRAACRRYVLLGFFSDCTDSRCWLKHTVVHYWQPEVPFELQFGHTVARSKKIFYAPLCTDSWRSLFQVHTALELGMKSAVCRLTALFSTFSVRWWHMWGAGALFYMSSWLWRMSNDPSNQASHQSAAWPALLLLHVDCSCENSTTHIRQHTASTQN